MGAIRKGSVCVIVAGREGGSQCVVTTAPENLIVEIITASGGKRKINARHLDPTGQTVKSNDEMEKLLGIALGKEAKPKKEKGEKKPKPVKKHSARVATKHAKHQTHEKKTGKENEHAKKK
ncbi:hypothetical protein COX84_00910 [Candidatus Micrarchaeota archaeon CG_4_10_14_0_2_um_filter_49_7]|nr:MAG: hypothetical protein AUJ13_04180 [Candidatus Micrarchaeota archaeon CG1_02_49_24]PIU82561.1 MAG: hypothetical protein COS70_00640 [Candidatus Micrarchaeota archaeon CG06_land_8_20_14_3_00_50_6]PIZ99501.1 MAG: hypothetical protein COX84_00910 [Candidatus Micrarchaeota archaeon CG_4_10_14_0_2_um_filter_49_7]HII53426.1 hypothetical protein [Candidatus Micrarchaeota archaeon]